MIFHKSLALTLTTILMIAIAKAQTVAPDRKDWANIGATNGPAPDYPIYYYKILQINASTDRYASILQLSIAGDANYFHLHGTFEIRVEKYEAIPNRFDGVEIRCTSGNPAAAAFYIFNDAVWVEPKSKWGNVYMRTVGDYGNSSPKLTTFPPSITGPVGALQTATGYGISYDFDNNIAYKLPHQEYNGNVRMGGIYTPIGGEVAPKLAVNGSIVATKVTVKQTGWADFVFDPAYVLPSLDSVETFIKQKGHLPEIPSIVEIEKTGQDLGEMNRKLLQKIEELTLYVIGLKRENEAQSQAIHDLQEEAKKK